MPIIASAQKKLRQDKKRTSANKQVIKSLKQAVRQARLSPTAAHLTSAFTALDLAAKKRVIHKNKAARLKSRLSKTTKSQKLSVKSANQNSK